MTVTYYSEFDRCLTFDPKIAWEIWLINGEEVPRSLFSDLCRVLQPSLPCPYCQKSLRIGHFPGVASGQRPKALQGDSANATRFSEELRLCTNCGFWRASNEQTRGIARGMCSTYAAAVQRVFPLDAPDAPLRELFEYLRRNPERLAQVNPKKFEKVVGECFRANWAPVEVKYVGGPADGGTDVLLIMVDQTRWLIQCKRRASLKASEGVRVVRELLGTLRAEDELRGIVVSTANHFTYQARQLAQRPNLMEAGYRIELYDLGVLREMLVGAPMGPRVVADASDSAVVVRTDGPWASFFSNGWS